MTAGNGAPTRAIRTPDQRLRIFVSSTLRELEAERRAARAAIEGLRLAPVMFELGARPHPPRDLYRAYLEQSDVFVGVYGDRYGWVAPGEEISGLEDEYRLTPRSMPKLIYIRESDSREARLVELIDRIRDDDTASYKSFSHPDELAELIEADLATLLAERFDASRIAPAASEDGAMARVPAPYTRLIGRDRAVSEVLDLLTSGECRLVTLLGPGGIGKSRLAIAVADAAAERFPDGTVFVMLENVLEPDLLLPTIGYALGIRDTAEVPLESRLRLALEGRRLLLVLDNFEQLVSAAPLLVTLYSIAPDAVFLVTSRTILRIRGERVYDVPPLPTHDAASPGSVSRALASPAVELFTERARAVKPDFEVTAANGAAVAGICRILQGLPLAIELAAARMRLLTPASILTRLDAQLPVLVGASRDLPERHRTLRSTIEWSTSLLRDPERDLLHDLGVFSYGFTLDSVETLGAGRAWAGAEMDALAALVDSSLVDQQDIDGVAVFSLLSTVREYAVGRLRARGEEDLMRAAHARLYADLALREAPRLGGPEQRSAVARLNLERSNLRSGVRHLIVMGDTATAAEVAWRLYLYWWIGGYLSELSVWMQELLEHDGDLSPYTRAVARFYVLWKQMFGTQTPAAIDGFCEVSELFAQAGEAMGSSMALAAAGLAQVTAGDDDLDLAAERLWRGAEGFRTAGARWGEVLILVALGRLEWGRKRDSDALAMFRRALDASVAGGDEFTATIATHHLARALLRAGNVAEARRVYVAGMSVSVALSHDEGIAYALEGLCSIAALSGDVERAGVLAGAAAAIRKRTGQYDAPAFVFHTHDLAAIEHGPHAAALQAAIDRGREYGALEAAEYALAGVPDTEAAATISAWRAEART
ncbi:ATP-binding protein [Microbacterium sp. NPDC078428]|uniref:ATP-binding protein n=1 Tax=Microbacterium sp. NPDC078428 TaxID=3364190 RepID=UPI0037C57DA6